MKSDYLTEKNPLQALTVFAIPIILGNLFQQLYTMADSAIVGRFVSEQALAAVGASYSLTMVFICVAIGGGIGASVVVSRHYGAKDSRMTRTAAGTALIAFLVLSILLGLFGLVFSRQIMICLRTPADVLDMAALYLRIYFIGLPFLFMYNILSSMFNAIGDSRTPLVFLIFSSVFNVGLDLLLVAHFQMGVAGAAWATLIAQGISAVLSFLVFLRRLRGMGMGNGMKSREEAYHFSFSRVELADMTRIALPSILQQSTVSIGMMLVQSVVNSFGSEVLAGYSAAMRVEGLCVVPLVSIGNALSPYTAQNIGAGKTDRVPRGLKVGFGMVVAFCLVIGISLQIFAQPIIGFFMGEEISEMALWTGMADIRFTGCFYVFLGGKMAVDGVLRGAGDVKMFTIANLVNLTIRVVLAVTLAPRIGVQMVWIAVPLGWLANLLISGAQYRTGKWRKVYAEKASII